MQSRGRPYFGSQPPVVQPSADRQLQLPAHQTWQRPEFARFGTRELSIPERRKDTPPRIHVTPSRLPTEPRAFSNLKPPPRQPLTPSYRYEPYPSTSPHLIQASQSSGTSRRPRIKRESTSASSSSRWRGQTEDVKPSQAEVNAALAATSHSLPTAGSRSAGRVLRVKKEESTTPVPMEARKRCPASSSMPIGSEPFGGVLVGAKRLKSEASPEAKLATPQVEAGISGHQLMTTTASARARPIATPLQPLSSLTANELPLQSSKYFQSPSQSTTTASDRHHRPSSVPRDSAFWFSSKGSHATPATTPSSGVPDGRPCDPKPNSSQIQAQPHIQSQNSSHSSGAWSVNMSPRPASTSRSGQSASAGADKSSQASATNIKPSPDSTTGKITLAPISSKKKFLSLDRSDEDSSSSSDSDSSSERTTPAKTPTLAHNQEGRPRITGSTPAPYDRNFFADVTPSPEPPSLKRIKRPTPGSVEYARRRKLRALAKSPVVAAMRAAGRVISPPARPVYRPPTPRSPTCSSSRSPPAELDLDGYRSVPSFFRAKLPKDLRSPRHFLHTANRLAAQAGVRGQIIGDASRYNRTTENPLGFRSIMRFQCTFASAETMRCMFVIRYSRDKQNRRWILHSDVPDRPHPTVAGRNLGRLRSRYCCDHTRLRKDVMEEDDEYDSEEERLLVKDEAMNEDLDVEDNGSGRSRSSSLQSRPPSRAAEAKKKRTISTAESAVQRLREKSDKAARKLQRAEKRKAKEERHQAKDDRERRQTSGSHAGNGEQESRKSARRHAS